MRKYAIKNIICDDNSFGKYRPSILFWCNIFCPIFLSCSKKFKLVFCLRFPEKACNVYIRPINNPPPLSHLVSKGRSALNKLKKNSLLIWFEHNLLYIYTNGLDKSSRTYEVFTVFYYGTTKQWFNGRCLPTGLMAQWDLEHVESSLVKLY